MLVVSCFLATLALLTYESAFPLAINIPIFLTLYRRPARNLLTWIYAWLGTVILLAGQFLVFLLSHPNNYQLNLQRANASLPFLNGLKRQIYPTISFFKLSTNTFIGHYWPYGLVAFVIILPLLWHYVGDKSLHQRYVLGILSSAIAIVLGISLYVQFPNDFRTQFFAAAFWALIFVTIGSFLPRIIRRLWLIGIPSLIIFSVMIGTLGYQETFEPNIRFEYFVKIFQQIHQIAPHIQPDTALLIVDPHGFLGIVDYHLPGLSRIALGVNAYRVDSEVLRDKTLVFTTTGVNINVRLEQKDLSYQYNQLIVFRVNNDQSVTLLSKLSSNLLPSNIMGEDYNPYARFESGEAPPLPFMHYLVGMGPLSPNPDIVAPNGGLDLVSGWQPYSVEGANGFRWASNDAEIVLTKPSIGLQTLTLDIEQGPSLGGQVLNLEVQGNDKRPIASIKIAGRQKVEVPLPAGLPAGSSIWLHETESANLPGSTTDPLSIKFRVFRITQASSPEFNETPF